MCSCKVNNLDLRFRTLTWLFAADLTQKFGDLGLVFVAELKKRTPSDAFCPCLVCVEFLHSKTI